MPDLSILSVHSKSCDYGLAEGTKKYALSCHLLRSHGRTLWKLKESSTVEIEDISCLFQNRLLLNLLAQQRLMMTHLMFLPLMWYQLVLSLRQSSLL